MSNANKAEPIVEDGPTHIEQAIEHYTEALKHLTAHVREHQLHDNAIDAMLSQLRVFLTVIDAGRGRG